MSKWTLRGYVPDSDEEEEDVESLSTNSSGRADASAKSIQHQDVEYHLSLKDGERNVSKDAPNSNEEYMYPDKFQIPTRPTTPSVASNTTYERPQTESPDPLQCSPAPKLFTSLKPQISSQILGEPEPNPFYLELLINSSQTDSELSDAPSLDEPPVRYASPTRQVEVRVIIPQNTAMLQPTVVPDSTAIDTEDAAWRAERAFRTRKPIQLNPYRIEGERYRQTFQRLGIKPVPRLKSPPRKPSNGDTETQEQEFDPENYNQSNSPPDILVSTPIIRKSKYDGLHKDSVERPSSSSRRNIPMSQPARLHGPPSTKRRKLNGPSTQAPSSLVRTTRRQSAGNPNADDIWAIPRSPPYSSSPPVDGHSPAQRRISRLSVAALAPDLPTPSNSSSLQGEFQLLINSDSESDVETTLRPGRQPAPPVRIPSVGSDTGSAASDSESVQSEVEVQRVGKKIKGVLPASWLRLDRQAQERKVAAAKARERTDYSLSPEKAEPQRGVAQRIINRGRTSRVPSSTSRRSKDLVVISDESDDDPHISVHSKPNEVRRAIQDASELATIFDNRYEGDSDNMEHDPLPLFTLGGPSRKRKRQLKLADAFGNSKKKARTSGGSKRTKSSGTGQHQHPGLRRARRTPPALSILDVPQSPSDRNRVEPQFLKLAKRQARRRPNLGRQSPSNKHIRLHTMHDTEDANITLHQWRTGALQPNPSLSQPKTQRQPLADRSNNQQRDRQPSYAEKQSAHYPNGFSRSISQQGTTQRHQNLPPGLSAFIRQHGASVQDRPAPTQSSSRKAKPIKPVRRKSLSLRAAQLEGLESDFGHSHRQTAFEKGLERADQQFSLDHLQPSRNPQLARFLANDDSDLPPLPTANAIEEKQESTPVKQLHPPKRRLIRKFQAQRIDVDTREYRQPNESTLQDLFQDVTIIDPRPEQEQLILQGLGPYGTQYPTSFDVSPLALGTYFHSSTFIGAEELTQALETGKAGKRDLDTFAGYHEIHYDSETVSCGPWNDETYSRIEHMINQVWMPLDNQVLNDDDIRTATAASLVGSARILRTLIKYFATGLSFLDTIDRREFIMKSRQLLESLFTKTLQIHLTRITRSDHQTIRTMTYLLVLSMQIRQIAQSIVVDVCTQTEVTNLITDISKVIVPHLVHEGASELGSFLEKNRGFKERENGVQEEQTLVESVVVCMHVLTSINTTGPTFWDLVSQALSSQAEKALHLKTFESVWASAFTLLPFVGFDVSGILVVNRRTTFDDGNWAFVRDLLKRLFYLYPNTFKTQSSSVNEYVRASLVRCHVLLQHWYWRRCDPMLYTVFTFFGSNHLKQLRREENRKSPRFLECLSENPSLDPDPSDGSFQIFLKLVARGLSGMKEIYPEKKIRSVVLRLTPNNGRDYPKDQPLDQDTLDALRNHHDLFCTLYYASPTSCRPKLDIIQSLVQHEKSHREACRLNVRAWANLTAFQLSSNEPYEFLRPFGLWHNQIMQQTLKQYQMAKTEAEDYLTAAQLDGTSDMSAHMVRMTINKNQQQVIATLEDCIAGMHRAVKLGPEIAHVRSFLIDSGIVELLELAHFDDSRLTIVICKTLGVLREYAALQKRLSVKEDSQPTSEESQDYGDFPDLADLEDAGPQISERSLDFVQIPLWHLLSNAFGADRAPADNLLTECVDTWVLIAGCQVSSGARSWSFYIDSFSQVSWSQLRHTDQTHKFNPYFLASLIDCDVTAYEEHRQEFLTALLLCLVDRESMLRFQHRLLNAILRVDTSHPLLQNLPFFRDEQTDEFDITSDILRSRRLALISSMLANIRADFHATLAKHPNQASERKREYAMMLQSFMSAMKSNYQQVRQGTDDYVEFVQKIVQFLKQYTSDICPVLPFFTDSVSFPLPAADPTYVVGRLCGYAPKLANTGVAKQLSTFMQTVAQQAASDNQQPYLVKQLSTALCNKSTSSADSTILRDVLLQGVFPAYIEAAFSSTAGMVIAHPVLQSLKPILETMLFDLRVADESRVSSILYSISSIAYTFIRSTESFKTSPELLKQPYVLHTLSLMLGAITTILPILEYFQSRTSESTGKPAMVTYLGDFNVFIAELLHNMLPHAIPVSPSFDQSVIPNADLLTFSTKDLNASMKTNWTENQNRIFFGHGHSRREVIADLGTVEEEQVMVVGALESYFKAVESVYGDGNGDRTFGDDVWV
jgi:hypothetical protein